MKHLFIDLKTQQSFIFSCKTEISNRIRVSAQTLRTWNKQSNIKQTKDFIICFDATEVKSKQKAHNRLF